MTSAEASRSSPRPLHGGPHVFAALTLPVAVAIVIVALVSGGIALAVVNANRSSTPTAVRPPASPIASASASATGSPPTATASIAASPGQAVTDRLIMVDGAVDSPDLRSLQPQLEKYFSAINDRQGRRALALFATGGVVDPNNPQRVRKFLTGVATTTDEFIQLHDLSPEMVAGSDGVAATLSFRSHQAASAGPHGQTCTDWRLTQLWQRAGSSYLLYGVRNASADAC